MFGRTPKLPIDLLFPQVNQPRLTIDEETSPIPGLDVLEEHITVLKPKVEEDIASLRRHLKYIGTALSHNRDLVMDKAKGKYDRRIKKENYKVGEWVLCSHPKIAKGMKKGIAFKYYLIPITLISPISCYLVMVHVCCVCGLIKRTSRLVITPFF